MRQKGTLHPTLSFCPQPNVTLSQDLSSADVVVVTIYMTTEAPNHFSIIDATHTINKKCR